MRDVGKKSAEKFSTLTTFGYTHTHTHTHTQEEDERGRRLFGQVCSSPRSAAACELNLLGFCTKIRVIKAN